MFRKPKWWDKPITYGQSVKGSLIATGIGLAISVIEMAMLGLLPFKKSATHTPIKKDPVVVKLTKEEAEKFSNWKET